MRRFVTMAAMSACILVAAGAPTNLARANGKAAATLETVTMKGEIIDPQCYFTHDSRGLAHAGCAAICAKGGQGLAFAGSTATDLMSNTALPALR